MENYNHKFVLLKDGLRMHYVEKGSGPMVVLLHGWPAFWLSWIHQIDVLANAGFRVIVPDQRGYGETDKPSSPDAYDIIHLTNDIVHLVEALHTKEATVIGHDWGAVVAWWSAYLHPHKFTAVCGLSVPWGFFPTVNDLAQKYSDDFYFVQHQQYPKFENLLDVEPFFRMVFQPSTPPDPKEPTTYTRFQHGIQHFKEHPEISLAPWFTKAELDAYVETFKKNGITTTLNWYRNWDRNHQLVKNQVEERKYVIEQPSLVMIATKDLPMLNNKKLVQESTAKYLPKAHGIITLDSGHWMHQEKADEVNNHLVEFLHKVVKNRRAAL